MLTLRRNNDSRKVDDSHHSRYRLGTHREQREEPQVTELLKRFEEIEIPPHQAATLGLSKDWKKNVTEGFVKIVLDAALKHKDALRELEKY